MDAADIAKLQVEAWSKTIEVQQHFNDIEMKIRALAITVLTAVLGVAALAVRDGTTLHIGRLHANLAGAIVTIGLIAWLLFYFVDKWWYHRLLMGSVNHGREIEKVLAEGGLPGFGLTSAVGAASPFTMNFLVWKPEVHSTGKIRIFYFTIAGLLLGAAIGLFASDLTPATAEIPAARVTEK